MTKAVREELSKLENEIKKIKNEFEKDTMGKQYYLLESSPMEEYYWTRAFRSLRDRVNIVIDVWELEVMRLNIVQEEPQ
jgi:hypothetical protein